MNIWLTSAKARRLKKDLIVNFLRRDCREIAQSLVDFCASHPDWQDTFSVFSIVDKDYNIESLEVNFPIGD